MSSHTASSPGLSTYSSSTSAKTKSRGSKGRARAGGPQQLSTLDEDTANRSPASHVVSASRTTGRSASRQTSSPYSAPVPMRRSARLRGQDPQAESRSQSPAEMGTETKENPTVGPGAHSGFGQSSFGGANVQIAPDNALGLGFGTAPSVVEAGPSEGSARQAARRSTRRVVDPSLASPTAHNSGQRTYSGKSSYRDRRRREESEDDYD